MVHLSKLSAPNKFIVVCLDLFFSFLDGHATAEYFPHFVSETFVNHATIEQRWPDALH